MPDISKCSNEECKLKKTCFRWTCKPNEYAQFVVRFTPNGDKCDWYVKTKQ